MKSSKYEIDMCNGTIMDKLISFALPLMLSGILQLMFNAVDIIVVGRFSGSEALAAVGSTTALINVFTNRFYRNFTGSKCACSEIFAADEGEMSETVHTAITLALISGILMAFVGLVFFKRSTGVNGNAGRRDRPVCFIYAHLVLWECRFLCCTIMEQRSSVQLATQNVRYIF